MSRKKLELPEDYETRRIRQIVRETLELLEIQNPPLSEEMLINLVWECRLFSKRTMEKTVQSFADLARQQDFSFTLRFMAAVLDRFEGRRGAPAQIERIADALIHPLIYQQTLEFCHWSLDGKNAAAKIVEARAAERRLKKIYSGYRDNRLPRARLAHFEVAELQDLKSAVGFNPTTDEVAKAFAVLRGQVKKSGKQARK